MVRNLAHAQQQTSDLIGFDPHHIRATEFAALKNTAYIDVASRAPVSKSVRTAVEHYLDMRSRGGDKAAMFEITKRVRRKIARFLNTDSENIAYTKNVSEGLNIVATGMNLQPGDKVIYCPEAEHPNNVYLWLQLQKTVGIDLISLPAVDGCIDSQSFIEAIDLQTKLVTASATTFAPGSRIDLKGIGQRCREVGAFFLVDGAQAVGTSDIDVNRDFIDGLAFSTQKGLLGLYGMGFLYCRAEWAETITPAYVARFSVDLEGHEADFSSKYELRSSALRFDLGNYNFLAAAAVEPSLDLLLGIGASQIDAYLGDLSHSLSTQLTERGLPVIGDSSARPCNIVTAGTLSDSNSSTSGSKFEEIHQALADADIAISSRRGLLRFSFHIYNTKDDVARVIAAIDQGEF